MKESGASETEATLPHPSASFFIIDNYFTA
jgi:hypothetical protein